MTAEREPPRRGRLLARRPGRLLADHADRLAAAAALALLLALALFGGRYHWVEEAGTAERDGYVAQAELLRGGSLPRDPYRPLLYPLLTAALAAAGGAGGGGDSAAAFAAARLLSNLAAAGLAWIAYAYGRRLAGAAAGGWAMALTAVNPNLWILGQHATTDMLFAALAAACLLAALRYLQSPAPAPAVAAGLALGLAAFTRANALFLVPALLVAWWMAGPGSGETAPDPGPAGPVVAPWIARRQRLGHVALAAAAAVLVLLPHWALRRAAFGNPFYDENWKNLAFKLYGFPDWSYLDRVPFRSAAEVIRHDPVAVVRGGLAELRRFAAAGAPQLFGTWAHVLLVVAGTLWVLTVPGRAARKAAGWLAFALASFLIATAFAFFTWGRLLLLLLPGAYALAFTPWVGWGGAPGGERPRARGRHARVALAALGAAAVLLLAVKTFGYRLPAFVARHPYVEVEVLRRLDRDPGLAQGAALGGSSPFLGRYLRHRYVALPDAFGEAVSTPGVYYAQLEPLLRREGVAYLVIGPTDLRSRPRGLLGPGAPVPWLAPAGGERGVVVWRVVSGR